jgi:hypothetical protein
VKQTAGNAFAPVPPQTDASGKTAGQFLREMFEFEYCSECGQDARQHTCVIGPTGGWFALCMTPVIFRKWPKAEGGGIIALFPLEPAASEYDCSSYEHVGQHGAATLDIIHRTRPATPAEYADLKQELESAPYFYYLQVRQRVPANAMEVRRRRLA